MTTAAFDAQMLIKLESGRILPTALPTRMWTGAGPILLDIGDGAGSVQWNGASFGNIETDGAVNVEKTAEGIPRRLAVAVGVDDRRPEIRAAVTGADLGPLSATLLFIVRETAGASLPPVSLDGYAKVANADPEPTLAANQILYVGNDTFRFSALPSDRERIGGVAVEGNRFQAQAAPGVAEAADARIVYASVATGTALDVWTILADGHGTYTEASAGGTNIVVQLLDPVKDQDWSFIADANGAPLVVRGRTGEMAYSGGLWTFEIETRVHDADRLLLDVWSNATQQARYSGDLFFEFTGEIESGLDFSWPN